MTRDQVRQMPGTSAAPPAGWVRVDCHLHTVASGDAVLTLAHARVTGEFRPHAPRYPRRPAGGGHG